MLLAGATAKGVTCKDCKSHNSDCFPEDMPVFRFWKCPEKAFLPHLANYGP